MELADLDLTKTYNYADYLQWTIEDRLELIKGKIFKMTPAPASRHQNISWVISSEMYGYLKGKTCKAYPAPFDVRLTGGKDEDDKKTFTVVQPDIALLAIHYRSMQKDVSARRIS